MSLGTSATLFGVAGQPIIDPSGAVCAFCDATGAWLPLICTLNCTMPAEEVCAAFGMSHADITKLAEAEPAGAGGVNFLPYLVGERTPNWPDSSGAVLGLKPGGWCVSLLPCCLVGAVQGAAFLWRLGYVTKVAVHGTCMAYIAAIPPALCVIIKARHLLRHALHVWQAWLGYD